jgi:hypothetical protein
MRLSRVAPDPLLQISQILDQMEEYQVHLSCESFINPDNLSCKDEKRFMEIVRLSRATTISLFTPIPARKDGLPSPEPWPAATRWSPLAAQPLLGFPLVEHPLRRSVLSVVARS